MTIVTESYSKQEQNHKGYHWNGPFHGHPNAGKAKHDVSSGHRDLQVAPVSFYLMPPTLHSSGMFGAQDVQFDINFRTMIGASLVLTVGILIQNKSLMNLTEGPLKANHREILRQKEATIGVAKSMDMMVHVKCHCITIKGDGGGGGSYGPPDGNGFYPNHLIDGYNGPCSVQVVGMVAIWMNCMVQVQKALHLLSQNKDIGKPEKIGMSSQVNLNRV